MKIRRVNFGFTLIELLVVIAVIGLLASIVMVSLNSAREKAKITRVKADMSQIAKAIKMYEIDVGELPPRGDSCPRCYYPDGYVEWNAVIDAMRFDDGSGWNGPYLAGPISQDPWGHHFLYDDNACNSNCGDSIFSSAGPDGVSGTGDDYSLIITTAQEVAGCCY